MSAEMERLGSFGDASVEPPADDIEYGIVTYFGQDIRIVTDRGILEIDLEAFMDEAVYLDATDPLAIGMIRGLLRKLVHPEDFQTFWRLVRKHRQGLMEQMGFAKYLIEEMTGHPIAGLSISSAGPEPTQPKSEDELSLRAQRRLEEQGRPDLAAAVVMARSRARAAG